MLILFSTAIGLDHYYFSLSMLWHCKATILRNFLWVTSAAVTVLFRCQSLDHVLKMLSVCGCGFVVCMCSHIFDDVLARVSVRIRRIRALLNERSGQRLE